MLMLDTYIFNNLKVTFRLGLGGWGGGGGEGVVHVLPGGGGGAQTPVIW